ncbi:hypothetical protein KP509_27G037300 [Ceratopteris richardii]|uniref:Uncharacterized protein n=1 Tax=Ceratopteris richardii TaxID=49495 RepID=A0A8T2RH42_CERRI|nr:hypothetical protein KP509_27G037300 [Ceratopteris richardii]
MTTDRFKVRMPCTDMDIKLLIVTICISWGMTDKDTKQRERNTWAPAKAEAPFPQPIARMTFLVHHLLHPNSPSTIPHKKRPFFRKNLSFSFFSTIQCSTKIKDEKIVQITSEIDESPKKKKKREKENEEKKRPASKGRIPLIVNGQHRILIKASSLRHPLVKSILAEDAEENDNSFHYNGAVRLSCDSASFRGLLRLAVVE